MVDNNIKVVLKNCAPFRKCKTEINETNIDEATHINIAMPMYNLIEYSDNYSDASRSLWKFKRDEIEKDVDLTVHDNHIQIVVIIQEQIKPYCKQKWGKNSCTTKLFNCKVVVSLT